MEIDFSVGGNSQDFKLSGWYAPERSGSWTEGYESVLRVPRTPAATYYQCKLFVSPYVNPEYVPFQEVWISVGGVDVFRTYLSTGGGVDFRVPASLTGESASFDIVFRCPNAVVPAHKHPGQDLRHLGLLVGVLTISPDAPERPYIRPPVPAVLGPPQKVAAVTMVYNEAEYLPIWLRHYSAQVGIENCFVVDHGSSDGSTNGLGACNVIRIPRSPYDPHKQSAFNSTFCSSLLTWYDWVVYSDVDEIILPDPDIAPTLLEYCRRPLPEVVTSIGLNTIHLPDTEPPLDLARPVSEQRPFVFGCSSMCKPNLIHRPILWSPGSHSADAPVTFDHLYMFHLRWFDVPLGLQRLQRTRAMEWGRTDAGAHQRVQDQRFKDMIAGFARLPQIVGTDLTPSDPPIHEFLNKVRNSQIGRENDIYKIDLGIWATHLWKVPQRFIGAF